jgi:hypothetical protein
MSISEYRYTLEENVPVDGIDDRFSLEFTAPPEGESGSIDASGIFVPPLLVSDKGCLSVFLGKKYLDDCRASGKTLDVALLIEKGEAAERDFLLHLVLLKEEVKGFNVVERSMVLKRFCDLAPGQNPQECIPPAVLTLFGVGRNERLLRNYLSLSESSSDFRLSVLRGELHEFTAFEIFRFPKEEWDELAKFVSKLFIGTKKRNGIVSLMRDISERDRVSAAELISDGELSRLFALHADPPQIAERVYLHFERLRYPRIAAYRERFLEKLKEARIDKRLRFQVPRDFETWEFSLEIPFSSVEELQRQIEKLRDLAERKAFRELMELRDGSEDEKGAKGIMPP